MPRPTTELSPYPTVQLVKFDNWTGVTTVSSQNPTALGIYKYSRNWFGSNTPGYKTYRRFNLPMRNHGVTLRWDQTGSYRWYDVGPGWNYTWTSNNAFSSSGINPPYAAHLEAARVKAASRLAKKLSSLKVNLGQAFGERKQTAELAASTATRVAHAARALRQGRFGDFYHALGLRSRAQAPSVKQWERVLQTKTSDRLANHWLEFQYGWKPLLMDLYGAIELLRSHIAEDLVHHRIRVAARESTSVQWLNEDSNAVHDRRTDIIDSIAKYTIDYRLDDAARSALASTGISNPALLAWELLPYSFVVDWFLPIGGYLEALDAYSGFTLVKGCLSQRTTRNYLVDLSAYRHKTYSGQSKTGWLNRRSVQFNRTNLVTFPAHAFPSFRNPLGGDPLSRLATALALLKVTFGR